MLATQRLQKSALRELLDEQEAVTILSNALKEYAQRNYRAGLQDELRDLALLRGAVDSAAPLWGERTACADGYVTLADAGRGLSLTVPTEKEGERFALVTRCYIGYDPETQQAGYEDMRYKAVVPLEEG